MTRDEWVVLPWNDMDRTCRRSAIVAYGECSIPDGATWYQLAGCSESYTTNLPLAEFEALLFAPATPAPDETYRDAAVRFAETWMQWRPTGADSDDPDDAYGSAADAFAALYRERHGG